MNLLPLAPVRRLNGIRFVLGALGVLLLASRGGAADLSEAARLYKAGKYAECVALSGEAIAAGDVTETWRVLRIESQLAMGQYSQASESLASALERYPFSIRLRWVGREAHRFSGNAEAALRVEQEIAELARTSSWRFRDAANMVTLGEFFLDHGADAKEVLTSIYDTVKKRQPGSPEAFVASGFLALKKHDYGLAATALEQAAKLDPLDPNIAYGLALAYAPSDSERATAALESALELNPRHAPSLLELVDKHVDAERYAEAETLLTEVLAVNDKHPLAWAYRAVLAHLDNDSDAEREARGKALATWGSNPEVDYLIGKKLSQKYRFAEGAAYQRQALALDAEYLPAQMQLSQDLLRLGEEDEGWALAAEVFDRDNYNVVAHNLATLRDRLEKFAILEESGFVVRMDAAEAEIYGPRVLQLLHEAKEELCAKYDVALEEPIYVDIYPRQQDFAIRTFGLPGGAGFLGVCFGRVITMNSPASQGATPSNWQAVLWHEFCHVVTLSKTNNRMPRWLSEGISVYEERQANAAWGQSMNLPYRTMILEGELTPVSKLSGAFLQPKSGMHLQFAYFESSLVVEYLVEKYGMETLQRILVDLGVGMPINESLQRYTGSLAALDQEFEAYARQKAEQLAPDADLTELDLPPTAGADELAAWLKEHPNSFYALQRQAKQLIGREQWQQALEPLEKLVEIYPTHIGPDNALALLAEVHRERGDSERERAVLNQLADLRNDAVDVYLRLAELATADSDWDAMRRHAEQALAVNPLVKAPHRLLAEAAEELGRDGDAIAALSALAAMESFDPADIHFRLARLLHRTEQLDEARRHVILALEEAPRFRAAHRLLLTLAESEPEAVAEPTRSPSVPAAADADESDAADSDAAEADDAEPDRPAGELPEKDTQP